MIYALTDETYSLLVAETTIDYDFSFWLSVLNHLYWVTGATLGVLVGHYFAFPIKGIEFCLTALFVVLTVEKAVQIRQAFPFVIAILSAILAKAFFPNHLLLIAMLSVCLMLWITYQLKERGVWIFQKHTA